MESMAAEACSANLSTSMPRLLAAFSMAAADISRPPWGTGLMSDGPAGAAHGGAGQACGAHVGAGQAGGAHGALPVATASALGTTGALGAGWAPQPATPAPAGGCDRASTGVGPRALIGGGPGAGPRPVADGGTAVPKWPPNGVSGAGCGCIVAGAAGHCVAAAGGALVAPPGGRTVAPSQAGRDCCW